jgi:hypothetical protein
VSRLTRLFIPLAIIVLSLMIGSLVGAGIRIVREPKIPAAGAADATALGSSPTVTDGVAPVAALPQGAQPIRAVFQNGKLNVLALVGGEVRLHLFTVDTATKQISDVALPLENAGLWAGLAEDDAGSIWAGAQNVLVRLTRGGATSSYTLPEPLYPLTGTPGQTGPRVETGQITALHQAGKSILIGRVGYSVLTSFDTQLEQFIQQPLPAGVGDIADFADGRPGEVLFTVNHSGQRPGVLGDVLGFVDVGALSIRAQVVDTRTAAANSRRIAVAGGKLAFVDGKNSEQIDAPGVYDLSVITLRSDDSIIVRGAASHELAVIDRSGHETSRIHYQVPIVRNRAGTLVPFDTRLAFLLRGEGDEVWFALRGYPAIYRAP